MHRENPKEEGKKGGRIKLFSGVEILPHPSRNEKKERTTKFFGSNKEKNCPKQEQFFTWNDEIEEDVYQTERRFALGASPLFIPGIHDGSSSHRHSTHYSLWETIGPSKIAPAKKREEEEAPFFPSHSFLP